MIALSSKQAQNFGTNWALNYADATLAECNLRSLLFLGWALFYGSVAVAEAASVILSKIL
jgi:hypothetical protein